MDVFLSVLVAVLYEKNQEGLPRCIERGCYELYRVCVLGGGWGGGSPVSTVALRFLAMKGER